MRSEQTTYRNQAAQRVLTVLNSFAGRRQPVSPADLSTSLQMSKNMIHRALTLLEDEGLIVRAPVGNTYQLGPRILTFYGGNDAEADDINAISRPYIERLADLTGESVFLGIIVGQNRVVIDKIEGVGRRIAHSQRGLAVPLHVSKASRVLLAYLSDDEVEAYLRAARPLAEYADLFADAAHETMADVWSDLREIREKGHIAWRNPQQYGGAYVAFPVLDSETRPQAVISVGAPIERMSVERTETLLPQMLQIVAELNERSTLLPGLPPLFPAFAA